MTHTITFQQSVTGNMHRATCSCGWFALSNSLAHVQLQASCHDLDAPAAPPLDAHPHDLYRALTDAGLMPLREYMERCEEQRDLQEAAE